MITENELLLKKLCSIRTSILLLKMNNAVSKILLHLLIVSFDSCTVDSKKKEDEIWSASKFCFADGFYQCYRHFFSRNTKLSWVFSPIFVFSRNAGNCECAIGNSACEQQWYSIFTSSYHTVGTVMKTITIRGTAFKITLDFCHFWKYW